MPYSSCNQGHFHLLDAVAKPSADAETAEIDYRGYKWRATRGGWTTLKRGGERAYFVCSNKRKTGCPARLQKTRTPFSSSGQTISVTVFEEHNHDAPQQVPLLNEVHQHARELCKVLTPSRVHEHLTRELREQGEESTPSNTPSRTQLRRKRVYQNRRAFPTTDATQNINLMHGPTGFLRENSSFPVVRIILATSTGLQLLRRYGSSVFTDTTFNVIEDDYKLTVGSPSLKFPLFINTANSRWL